MRPIVGKAGATMVCSSADRNIASMMPMMIESAAAWPRIGPATPAAGPSGSSFMILSSTRRFLARGLRNSERPAHDPVFQVLVRNIILAGADLAANRDAGVVDAVGIARDERVPPIEVAAIGQQTVAASRR